MSVRPGTVSGPARARAWLTVTPGRVIILILLLLMLAPAGVSGYFAADIIARAMLFAILALALELAWGYGGILSLGHSAFFGIGAYAVAIVLLRWDSALAPYVAFALAILLPTLLAVVVGWFIFYGATSILYVAIVTLSLPVLLSAIDLRIPQLTGGLTGLSGIPTFPWDNPLFTYYAVFAALVMSIGIVYWMVYSDFGRLLVAVRDNEQRARCLGYDTPSVRLFVFAVSGALAGFAGALYAPYNGFVSHSLLGLGLSTSAIVWVAIGGRGTIAGPLLGALIVNVLEPTLSAAFPGFWQLVLGLVFVVTILLFPSGLYGLLAPPSRGQRALGVLETSPSGRQRVDMTVTIDGVRLAFGSLTVLRDLSMEFTVRKLHCLIGPNGAGKSTLINVVTGFLRPSAGRITVNEIPIHSRSPDAIARLGVLRTFQASNVFETLSVGDNLMLARVSRTSTLLFRRSTHALLPPYSLQVLELSGLRPKLDVRASDLGHGERKWLELCMVLTAEPQVIFLDEPTAGLSAADRKRAGEVLVALVREHGLGLLLIEHDLEFVKSIAERLTVLSQGKIIADGTVATVADSPEVQQIYLGHADLSAREGSG